MPGGGTPVLPSDVPRLRTLRTWHAMWVEEIDKAIALAEKRDKERRQGEERRPPTPDWVMEHGIGAGAPEAEVHVGGCYAAGHRTRAISRDQAVAAITGGVRACSHCRPDTELGLLE
ncbi:DUF6233 domain-containing protein [Streptomyces sp. BE147]|uniref:DUF6233 domain-containing protein n=1 Tax=Streptomyces sp. BE147 TaxID=3002524 RepID=UPI002E78AEA0|nr:DUF6233 domain-containing protein [Streptomyces sp. BE147]MEE1737008.1 DUF6233 domain-containing protein [Streptomyces sp. BE147]